MAEDEAVLKLRLESQQYTRAWADVRAQTTRDLATVRQNVTNSFARIANQMRTAMASANVKAKDIVDPKAANALGELGRSIEGVARAAASLKGGFQSAATGAQSLFSSVGQKAAQGVSAVSEGVAGLVGKLPGLAAGLSSGGAGFAGLAVAGVALVSVLAAVGAAVVTVGAAVAALAVALPVAINLLQRIFDKGIDYNSQLEQTKLGIAAVIASLAELQTAQGRKIEGPEALNASLDLAQDQLEKLKVNAVQTTATFEQIAPAFQAAIGPGIRAGLTLDQIRETVVRITQAAGAVGVPFAQLNQEVRAILEGTINEDARLAKILGISNEMVKKWREQGTLAEELNKRLEQFGTAGEKAAGTLEGLKSNLQEALNVFSGEATTRTFSALKEEFQKLLPQLFDFKAAGIQAQFKSLAELADDVLVRVVRLGGSIAQDIVAGLKRVSDFVTQNRAIIDDILNLCVGVIKQLIEIGRQIVEIATAAGTWRTTLDLVHSGLTAINIALALMVAKLQEAEPSLRLLLLAANAIAIVALGGITAGAGGKGAGQTQPTADLSGGTGAFALPVISGTRGGSDAKKDKGADKARREALRQLEQEERAIRELYERETDALKREFDLQLTSSRTFTKGIIDEAEERFSGLQAVYAKQLAVAKNQSDRDKINNDLAKAERERDKAVQEAKDAQYRREVESLTRHRDNLLDVQERYDSLAVDAITKAAEESGQGYEEAEESIYKIQTAAFERRLQAARDDEARFYEQQADINDVNVELAREYSDRIATIVAEQERVEEEHRRRVVEGQRKDLEARRKYLDALTAAEDAYQDKQKELKRKEIERGLRSPFAHVQVAALTERLGLEISEINQREQITKRRLDGEELAVRRDYERRNQDIKNTKEYFDTLLLLHEEYEARRRQAEEEANLDRQDAVERGNADLKGTSDRNPFDIIAEKATESLGLAASQAQTFGNIINSVFNQVAQGVGNAVAAFVKFGTIQGGFKKFAIEVIASIAQMSIVQSVFEAAQALAMMALAFFTGNPNYATSAAAHWAAAAAFGAIGGLAAGVGRTFAGSSLSTGAAGNLADNGAARGTTSGSTTTEEDRTRREARTGGSPDPNSPQGVTQSIAHVPITLNLDGQVLERKVVHIYRKNGELRGELRGDILGEAPSYG